MNIQDAAVRREVIHNQVVFIPNSQAWDEILRDRSWDNIPLLSPDFAAAWLKQYGQFPVAHLGLIRRSNSMWRLLPLLKLSGRYYRVHFENVICEHCTQRCGPSATPDTVSYAGTGYTPSDAWNDFRDLPIRNCPHCRGTLRRRQTIWLAHEDAV